LLCSLRHTLPSSPTTSFSLLLRGVSLLYKTRTTPRRVFNRMVVYQGQSKTKRGLCLLLVGALELLLASDSNGLFEWPKFRIRILVNHVFLDPEIDRSITARDVLNRR
jgi:hypothetical protein